MIYVGSVWGWKVAALVAVIVVQWWLDTRPGRQPESLPPMGIVTGSSGGNLRPGSFVVMDGQTGKYKPCPPRESVELRY